MIDPADYEFLTQFLMKQSGLFLGSSKEYLLEARLIPLAQSWGLPGIRELTAEVRRHPNQQLAQGVIEAMTTNETLFFRDKTPFDELCDQLLPPIIEARRATRSLRIWSAAASTGQESYSLAMLLKDKFPALQSWQIELFGTDLSKSALAKAEAGLYSQFEVQRGLPVQMLVKHFTQQGEYWRIKDDLRRGVKFRSMNLLDSYANLGTFDIIFCRNVLIYFESPVKKSILDRMSQVLKPDGYLILGAAETVLGVTETFQRHRQCRSAVYTKRALVPA